jgi:Na+/H+ antiporter NhaD/arsenite permease-like protein
MLLIRPWIALNRDHFRQYHVAFFIFVISNIGGALLPIGPPLLLGYVKGVPFWWVLQRCWQPWCVMLGAVLLAFYLFDRRHSRSRTGVATPAAGWKLRCEGGANFLAMAAILVCLIALPGGWRELVIAIVAIVAYWIGSPEIRLRNEFTFAPLKEIAWIFLGIFGTMIPVLDYMERHAGNLGLRSDLQFYWATGALSALLDNAPAYLTLFAGALGLHGLSLDDARQISEFLQNHGRSLVAISLGATSFGALTYIGNGPNLLVKAIAEHANVPTPGFLGYIIKFALPVLIPVFILVALIFLR